MSKGSEPPVPETCDLDRLLALVRRQNPHCRVRFVDREPDLADRGGVTRQLPDGRWLVVAFDADADSSSTADHVARRVDMLMDCFAHTLKSEVGEVDAEPAPVARSLERELEALAQRAGGVDALVIDMASPIVWCSATVGPTRGEPRDQRAQPPGAQSSVGRLRQSCDEVSDAIEESLARRETPPPKLELVPEPIAHLPRRSSEGARELPTATRQAIGLFHELADLGPKHNGGRAVLADGGLGLVAHGFADIYVLIVVFEEAFEELRAERAVANALPRIERLVVALPPLDPTPERPRKVISLRAGRPR